VALCEDIIQTRILNDLGRRIMSTEKSKDKWHKLGFGGSIEINWLGGPTRRSCVCWTILSKVLTVEVDCAFVTKRRFCDLVNVSTKKTDMWCQLAIGGVRTSHLKGTVQLIALNYMTKECKLMGLFNLWPLEHFWHYFPKTLGLGYKYASWGLLGAFWPCIQWRGV
jgi:hypothetical protein